MAISSVSSKHRERQTLVIHTDHIHAATLFLRHAPARQRATLDVGRLLEGQKDELVGYEQSFLQIEAPHIVTISGETHHPIVKFNGRPDSRVSGTVFEITDAELASADQYEVSAYTRMAATLATGKEAWVYVGARFAPRARSHDHDAQ
jgi:gamma-glutamylcyclotransferase (GGCT)/AIG2-like uncharacterized protein YtfP